MDTLKIVFGIKNNNTTLPSKEKIPIIVKAPL